jgi:hypothetical protein
MSLDSPDKHISAEIRDINREFLRLVTHRATDGAERVLGLDGGVLAALRQLSAEQQERIAHSPVPLVEFHPFPGLSEIRDRPATCLVEQLTDPAWQYELHGFVNRLLTCIWQTARRDRLMTSLFIGIDRDGCRVLSTMSFCRISRFAADAADALQIRLADHPSFWPDLIRLARKGNRSQQVASRLSAIQLSVARQWPGSNDHSGPRYL